jgi:hypothetical protein
VYRAKHGAYPDDLARLDEDDVAAGSLSSRAKEWSFRYYLTPGGARYILL